MTEDKVFQMKFSKVYPLLVNKAVRKGRSEQEVIQVICWLTGYTKEELKELLENEVTYQEFFEQAHINPNSSKIKGVVCGIRVENIENPLMQKIRYLDKLVDELAKGKAMDKILRS